MNKTIKRELHGILLNGERIFLGSHDMADGEVREFLEAVAEIYSAKKGRGFFNIKSSVYTTSAFAGIQVTPLVSFEVSAEATQ